MNRHGSTIASTLRGEGMPSDLDFMQHALLLAGRAEKANEVPVGAVLVHAGVVIAEGWNQPIGLADPTAHAEIVAIRAAALQLGNYRLNDATLYVTLEPCAMCMGAAINARLARVVFGAWDPTAGACGSVFDLARGASLTHRVDVFGGVCDADCRALLRRFFSTRR